MLRQTLQIHLPVGLVTEHVYRPYPTLSHVVRILRHYHPRYPSHESQTTSHQQGCQARKLINCPRNAPGMPQPQFPAQPKAPPQGLAAGVPASCSAGATAAWPARRIVHLCPDQNWSHQKRPLAPSPRRPRPASIPLAAAAAGP
jgi:hypothetical protein